MNRHPETPRTRRDAGPAGDGARAALPDNPKLRDDDAPSNRIKDPADWITGDEPMTGAQASYLKTLSEEAGEGFDPGLSKADASRRIDELQEVTGRGADGSDS